MWVLKKTHHLTKVFIWQRKKLGPRVDMVWGLSQRCLYWSSALNQHRHLYTSSRRPPGPIHGCGLARSCIAPVQVWLCILWSLPLASSYLACLFNLAKFSFSGFCHHFSLYVDDMSTHFAFHIPRNSEELLCKTATRSGNYSLLRCASY